MMSVDNSEQLRLAIAQKKKKLQCPHQKHTGPVTLLGVLEKNLFLNSEEKKNVTQHSLGSSLYQLSHEILF